MAFRMFGHVSPVKAAELIGVSKETIFNWIKKKKLKTTQMCDNGAHHISYSEIERITGTKIQD